MSDEKPVFIYIGTYASEAAAQDDYQIVKDLRTVGDVGTYDGSRRGCSRDRHVAPEHLQCCGVVLDEHGVRRAP